MFIRHRPGAGGVLRRPLRAHCATCGPSYTGSKSRSALFTSALLFSATDQRNGSVTSQYADKLVVCIPQLRFEYRNKPGINSDRRDGEFGSFLAIIRWTAPRETARSVRLDLLNY